MCIGKLGFGAPVYFCRLRVSTSGCLEDRKIPMVKLIASARSLTPGRYHQDPRVAIVAKGEETEPWMKLEVGYQSSDKKRLEAFQRYRIGFVTKLLVRSRMVWKRLKAKGQLHSNDSQRRYHDIVKVHSLAFSELVSAP